VHQSKVSECGVTFWHLQYISKGWSGRHECVWKEKTTCVHRIYLQLQIDDWDNVCCYHAVGQGDHLWVLEVLEVPCLLSPQWRLMHEMDTNRNPTNSFGAIFVELLLCLLQSAAYHELAICSSYKCMNAQNKQGKQYCHTNIAWPKSFLQNY
jgi:hypothetical protein